MITKIKLTIPLISLSLICALQLPSNAQQSRVLSIKEAVEIGIENSKTLKLSQAKVDEAVSRYQRTAEEVLPKASVSYVYNHATFLNSEFKLPGNDNAIKLPSNANAFLGTLSVQQLIFAGNRLKYAKESTNLLTQIARLDADRQKEAISIAIINNCYSLYRVQQSKKVIDQNLESVGRQLTQANQFFRQGIVTKNDVLRFQLQKNNVQLTGLDLEANRKIVNYNLNILLGLPEATAVEIQFDTPAIQNQALTAFIDSALSNREEIKEGQLRSKIAGTNVKSLQADYAPVLGAGTNLYYINPNGTLLPAAKSFLAPLTIGASLSWNIDKLWTNKSKIAEAKIQQNEAQINTEIASDNIKTEVNAGFQNYLKSIERIKLLEQSIEQARENDRILESKYRNNIASATDRIDAQTQLYQALINLELAKADASLAYYSLLNTTGTLTHQIL